MKRENVCGHKIPAKFDNELDCMSSGFLSGSVCTPFGVFSFLKSIPNLSTFGIYCCLLSNLNIFHRIESILAQNV